MDHKQVQVRKATKHGVNRRNGTHMSTIRVAAYARVSTDSAEQLESYRSQVQHYEQLIGNNPEWQMVGVYADEGITGTKTIGRAEFNRMINDCMNGEIDMIICKSISRFARNTVDTLRFVRMLKEKQIAVMFEEENLNTMSMDGELLLTILSSVAQQEVQNISEHVKLGLAMKMQRGELVGFHGCLGFDYNKESRTITVNEAEAEIVRYIFKRYTEGAGGKLIARELNNLGYVNKKGERRFSEHGVIGVIKNEKYKGDLLMGKTFTVDPITKRRLINLGEADQYYIENHHEPIVSRELFEQAQAILNKRNGNRSKPGVTGKREKFSREFAFSCMLKCGFCGGNLTRRSWNAGTEYQKTVWQCVAATKHGKHECPYSKGIPESLIEEAFVRSYNALCSHDGDFVDSFLERVKNALQGDDFSKEVKAVDREIYQLKERKSQLVDMRLDGKVDEETYQMKVVAVNTRLDELKAQKLELMQSQEAQQDINERLAEFQRILSNHEPLRAFDRRVFECIVEKVVVGEVTESGEVDPYKLKFVYKTGAENEVAIKQPFSFENPCCYGGNECDTIYPRSDHDTCRVLCATLSGVKK